MSVLVQTYVGSRGRALWFAARHIAGLRDAGHDVVAVVSDRTAAPTLLALAAQVGTGGPERELDQLLATAGSTQAALLALALHRVGIPAVALDGAQAGVRAVRGQGGDAVTAVAPTRIRSLLAAGRVVIVAGAQGVDADGDIVVFGPDGCAVTADAIAATLRATGEPVVRLPIEGNLMNSSFAHEVRLRRLIGPGAEHMLVVPLDHSVTDGSAPAGRSLDRLIGQVRAGGADAVVLHKGSLRYIDPCHFVDLSLIVHMSAGTVRAPDPDAKCLVATVEEALRLGADAVSMQVNLGSRQEQLQIRDLAAVGRACERWNLPLLAMMYVRGAQLPEATDPGVIAHAAILAADFGADLVKIAFPGSVAGLAEVVRRSPVPVLVAGGQPGPEPLSILSLVRDVQAAGAFGVAAGRAVFQAPDPAAVTRKIADLLHARFEPIEGVRS